MTLNKKIYFLLISFLIVFTSSCYKVPNTIDPNINFSAQERYLKQLPPAFPPLTQNEKEQAWGKEYLIGERFAKELDFYRAITTFKRAEFLLGPETKMERLQEIQYQIILCYYLGKRYNALLEAFNRSSLYKVGPEFATYHDLLIILYESYIQTDQKERAAHILSLLHQHFPESAKKIELSISLSSGDLNALEEEVAQNPSNTAVASLLRSYEIKKKSVSKAQSLNILPGAGYLYVGQKQSALTAFLLNGLFIAASVRFFQQGHIAAGIITTSFEAGWYFGGIYGAGEAAKTYNERVYEKQADVLLRKEKLFPLLMLRYGF